MSQSPQPDRPTVWLLLDRERAEFAESVAQLDRLGRLVRFNSPEELLEAFSIDPKVPELLVLALHYPERFPSESIESIRQKMPYLPIVGLLGSWCEGEARSGNPPSGVTRVYWHQWFPPLRDRI